MSTKYLDKETVWVCMACGKTSPTQIPQPGESPLGWDESCMLNSAECFVDSLKFNQYGEVTKCERTMRIPDESLRELVWSDLPVLDIATPLGALVEEMMSVNIYESEN